MWRAICKKKKQHIGLAEAPDGQVKGEPYGEVTPRTCPPGDGPWSGRPEKGRDLPGLGAGHEERGLSQEGMVSGPTQGQGTGKPGGQSGGQCHLCHLPPGAPAPKPPVCQVPGDQGLVNIHIEVGRGPGMGGGVLAKYPHRGRSWSWDGGGGGCWRNIHIEVGRGPGMGGGGMLAKYPHRGRSWSWDGGGDVGEIST